MRSVAEIFSSYEILDSEGRHINGTDKNGPNHNYGDAYESILTKPDQSKGWHDVDSSFCSSVAPNAYTSIRDEVKLMMEIGVADGSSLLAWREIFPNSLCVGMDIHPAQKLLETHWTLPSRTEFHLGDQRIKEDCERAAAGRQFDLIVEDATHNLEDTLRTLYWMWPFVRPGGLYIVEEWPSPDRNRIASLWPQAEVVDTVGPFGGVEPLIVFRKPT